MRCTFDVEYDIETDEKVYADKIQIPPMLIQPVVENVFKHAFDQNTEKGILNLTLEFKDQYISCTVRDNGCGFSNTNSERTHSGSNITQKRLKMICEKMMIRYNYQIQNNENSGTSVTFNIPFKSE